MALTPARPEPDAAGAGGQPARYVAVVGLNWLDALTGEPRRAEPGDAVPAELVAHSPWVLEQGLVRAEPMAPDHARERS